MTNEQHNRYIAYTFLGHGAFQIFMLLVMAAFFFFAFSIPDQPGQPEPPMAFLGFIFGFVALIYFFFTAPSLVPAYALLKKKSWARVAAIVAGVMASMSVPVGTAACVYSLWFFLGDNWKEIYTERPGSIALPIQIDADGESRWTGYQTDEKGEPVFRAVEPPDWR